MITPAGFWRRYAAYSLDMMLLALLLLPLAKGRLLEAYRVFLADIAAAQQRLIELLSASLTNFSSPLAFAHHSLDDPTLRTLLTDMAGHLSSTLVELATFGMLAAALYFIGFEASPWQATPGKRWLGLQVTTRTGTRPRLARTALRFLAAGLSWLSLNLGHALAAWRSDKRALHDLVAGTRVQCAHDQAWPRSALLWLGLQLTLTFAGLAWLLYRYLSALMQLSAASLS